MYPEGEIVALQFPKSGKEGQELKWNIVARNNGDKGKVYLLFENAKECRCTLHPLKVI
jgi:hypothetical protein